MKLHRTVLLTCALAVAAAYFVAIPASAHAPSGAIFTTTATGDEVNANQYAAKEDVYLDGGPGPGAPQTAAGLDDGVYVFQVTDPSGKVLLSTDPVACRQFRVEDGIIVSVAESGACAHVTGIDEDHGALTVQLMPFNDTPNHGGVYKVWVTFREDYACFPDLSGVDCDAGGKHGFIPAHSKTDNFKVRPVPIREFDAFFIDQNTGQHLSGLQVTWLDTVGASNTKWSYYVPFWDVIEAHVEAVEDGTHGMVLENQPGCTIGDVYLQVYTRTSGSFTYVGSGPQTVYTTVKGNHYQNHIVHVYCAP